MCEDYINQSKQLSIKLPIRMYKRFVRNLRRRYTDEEQNIGYIRLIYSRPPPSKLPLDAITATWPLALPFYNYLVRSLPISAKPLSPHWSY
jgi:hypothetical protein